MLAAARHRKYNTNRSAVEMLMVHGAKIYKPSVGTTSLSFMPSSHPGQRMYIYRLYTQNYLQTKRILTNSHIPAMPGCSI